jgi:hypothetical protein
MPARAQEDQPQVADAQQAPDPEHHVVEMPAAHGKIPKGADLPANGMGDGPGGGEPTKEGH